MSDTNTARSASDLKITDVNLFRMRPRWNFLRIETNQPGLFGAGEPVLEGRPEAVLRCVEELRGFLLGRNPLEINDINRELRVGEFYYDDAVLQSAISGIDAALWDIFGKEVGRPVFELLGGKVRDRVEMYRWFGGDPTDDDDPYPDNHQQVAENALALVEEYGYRRLKMNAISRCSSGPDRDAVRWAEARLMAVVEALNGRAEVGIDFHARTNPMTFRECIRALDPLRPAFYEEPVGAHCFESLTSLRQHTTTPFAFGERQTSMREVERLIRCGAVDILQMDPMHAGGISAMMKYSALAEASEFEPALAPHCPLGPIALAVCMQLGFASPMHCFQESSIGIHYNATADLLDYLRDPSPFDLVDGHIPVSQFSAPGLGIEVDWDKVEKQALKAHEWTSPRWRDPLGRITRW